MHSPHMCDNPAYVSKSASGPRARGGNDVSEPSQGTEVREEAETASFTCVVVGSGPAGVACARELALAGNDVLLAEASSLPRRKSCGGMLNEYAQRFLAQVGGVPRSLMLDPAYVHFRYYDWDRRILKPTALRFVNVDRAAFDEWTLSLLPPGVTVWDRATLTGWKQDKDGVTARIVRAGQEKLVHCAFLVGADGARSAVRRGGTAWSQVACYKTVQEFVRITPGTVEPYFDCIYSRHIAPEYGYGYIMPKGDVAVVGSVFFPGTKGMPAMHERALETFARRYPLGESVRREAGTATQVRTLADVIDGQGRVFLAGEAAGLMSPSSGEGISFAFNSGQRAGRALAAGLRAGTGQDAVDIARANYVGALVPIRRNIARRLMFFPVMNSDWGKWIGGSMPTPLVSWVTQFL